MELERYGRLIDSLGERYYLERSLGSGGMADVCLAWDEQEERAVAIKVIKQDQLDQRTLDRFMREAARIASWRHPNILRIYSDFQLELLDAELGSVIPYIVMEYAEGGDLQRRLRPGQPWPLPDCLRVFEQLCSAVAYAHRRGVIHRDLKPLNILFRPLPDGSEQVVLSDFGLAISTEASHITFARGGTPHYMAPEQFRGVVLPACDIFALGVILYQLCTGRRPFQRTVSDLLPDADYVPPTPPSSLNPQLPPALDAVLLCALAEDPDERFASADLFWQAVRAACTPALQNFFAPESRTNDRTGQLPARTAIRKPAPHKPAPHKGGPYISRGQESVPPASMVPEQTPATLDDPPPTRSGRVTRPDSDPAIITLGVPAELAGQPPAAAPPASLRPPVSRPGRRQPGASRPSIAAPPASPRPPARGGLTFPGGKRVARVPPWQRVALVVVLLLVVALLAVLNAPWLSARMAALWTPSGDVTITAASALVSDAATVQVVTTTPDAAHNQIAGQQLSANASSSPARVNAGGHNQSPGTQARGQLTFLNGAFVSQTVPLGTIIGIKNGLQVATDEDAVMPAAIPGGQLGQKSVPAHIVTSGSAGNIAALYIDQECCAANNSIFVKNLAAFTGGQDAKDYRFVRQGDVDAYVKANRGGVEQAASEQLKQQIEARHLTAGSPGIRCTTTASGADGQVGDQGRDIPSVSITLNATCSALAYNQSDLDRLLTAHLNARAARDHGPAYRLVGAVSSRVDSQQASPAGKPAPLTLTTSARGFYVYQFDSASKQRLARLIAGKSRAVAQSLLAQQPGIASASIAVDPLPADPARVSIVIKVPSPSA